VSRRHVLYCLPGDPRAGHPAPRRVPASYL